MMRFTFLNRLSKRANTLLSKEKEDYLSVWRDKPHEAIRHEIHVINELSSHLDKYIHTDKLKSSDKLEMLKGVLRE